MSNDSDNHDVLVVDAAGQTIDRVHSAVARYVLRNSYATVLYKEPFTIQLTRGLTECPQPEGIVVRDGFSGRRVTAQASIEVVRVERQPRGTNVNKPTTNNYAKQMDRVKAAQNFVTFFEAVSHTDKLIWAKATAPKGSQVALEVKDRHGNHVNLPPIKPGDPVNLTDWVSFEELQQSGDLRQLVAKNAVKLMTSAQVDAYYIAKGEILQEAPETLIEKAKRIAAEAASGSPSDGVDKSQLVQSGTGTIEENINEHIHHLCEMVGVLRKDNDRMPVKEFMEEIMALEDSMTLEEFEYVHTFGYYPTVKKWAEQRLYAKAKEDGLVPETDELST